MRKILVICFITILMIKPVEGKAMSDCEYFVLPQLGINEYTACLANPDNYSSYFIYHAVTLYDGTYRVGVINVREGEDAVIDLYPTKTGYFFDGWDKPYTNIQEPIDLYTQFTKGMLVTYLDYDGSELDSELLRSGEDGTPPTPTRTGYTFTGWSGSYLNVTSDITLMAQYEASTFTVKFYSNGSLIKTDTVNYNSDATPPSNPSISGKVFTGWDKSYVNITGDLLVNALFDDIYYSITFDLGDSTSVANVIHGGIPVAPTAVKEGYDFLGWTPAISNVYEDTIFSAEYSKKSFLVRYYDESNNVLSTQNVLYQEAAVQPTYVEPVGKTLTGWSEDDSSITSNLDIYPVLENKTYIVTFTDNESINFSMDVTHGGSCTPDIPDKTGHIFIALSEPCSDIDSNKTITLNYDPEQLTVSFYDFDDQLISEEVVNYGSTIEGPTTSDFEKYDLTGWSVSLSNITTDLSVYPIGSLKTFSVTFKDYDGSTLCSSTVKYGDTASCSLPSRRGYSFTGWNQSLVITDDVTIFATYKAIYYEVKYYSNDELVMTEEVRYSRDGSPPQVEMEGYTFTGWSGSYEDVIKDTTLHAVFEKKICEVSFMDYDMNLIQKIEVPYGDVAVSPIVDRPGFIHIGWSDSLTITDNITLIAQYEQIMLEVSFYSNDQLIETKEIPYGINVEAPSVNFEGYSFVGWDKDLSNITSNMNVNAIWDEVVLKVRYFDEDELLYEEDVIYGMSANPPVNSEWSVELSSIYENVDAFMIKEEIVEIYYDYFGNVTNQDYYLPGYEVSEWQSIINDNLVEYYPELEVNTEYLNSIDSNKCSVNQDNDGVMLYFLDGIIGYEFGNIFVNGVKKDINDFQYEVDKKTFIDRTVNWIFINDLNVEDIDYIEVYDNANNLRMIDLRSGTSDLIYNIVEDSELSLWNRIKLWIERT